MPVTPPPIVLTANELYTNLTNLALNMHFYATNTSNKSRDFLDIFMTETIGFGNTKIFPATDMPEVFDYSETSTVTTVTKTPVKESYLQISERKVIKESIPNYVLEMAFTSESGMNQFVGYMLGLMEDSRINYLYNDTITQLFGRELKGNMAQTVKLLPLPTTGARDINDTDLYNQKQIELAFQKTIDAVQYYSKDYNEFGYTQNINLDDMVLVWCQPFYNQNVINLMATLLNSSQVDKGFAKPKVVTIPQTKIPSGQENVIGFLMHKKAFQLFYKFTATLNFYDASNLYINYFHHFWYGRGFVGHLPMIKFTANYAAAA